MVWFDSGWVDGASTWCSTSKPTENMDGIPHPPHTRIRIQRAIYTHLEMKDWKSAYTSSGASGAAGGSGLRATKGASSSWRPCLYLF